MTPNYLEYPLNDGFVDHWLVLGPLAEPVEGAGVLPANNLDFKVDTAKRFYDPAPAAAGEAIESGYVFVPGKETSWKYYRCREDHLVDIGSDYPNWRHVSVYAYTQVHLSSPFHANVLLECNGPVDVWVNGEMVFHADSFAEGMEVHTFPLDLQQDCEILVRTRQVGNLSCLNLIRFQLTDLDGAEAEEIQICLPTKARYPSRFQELEKNLESAHMEEAVNFKGAKFNLRWAEGTSEDFHFHYQVQDDQERIYVEGTWQPEANGTDIGHTFRLFERPFRIVLKAPPREYYEMNTRYQREMPLYVLDTSYATEPSGTYASRRAEALKDAAKHETNLYGQIAQIILGKLDQVQPQVFKTAAEAVQRLDVGCEILLMGLLGTVIRVDGQSILVPVEDLIRETAASFYGPGTIGWIHDQESHQIAAAACKVLAGQVLDQAALLNAGVQEAMDWIRMKGTVGFKSWHSNSEMELVIAALAHLTSLANHTELQELAAVLLDKVLFDLAVNSFQGAYTASHGATEAGMLKSAQLEATSGIMRMIYGMGVYNPHITGLVSLAVADYEFPTFFGEIARDKRGEMVSRENHAGASTVTYRTPDYLLGSVQDWRAGQPGGCEQVWQAAFGPDALVFTNHPACMSEAAARRPGYWLGNAVLPRVAQWKDSLVAVYSFENIGMDFTHAHFPVYKFDEYLIQDGWAFARKGDGYLALTAARGLELVKGGPGAYRELRSYGSPNIWICQMGRAALDGSFADFQAKIRAMRLEWPGNSARFTSLRGESIEFGWQGALIVDGAEQSLTSEKAIENPYCSADLNSTQYEIQFGEIAMRLNFE